MTPQRRTALAGIAGSLLVGSLVAFAGSDGSAQLGGIAVFALCGLLAYVINWVAFVPSNLLKTERYYDLTGSITYVVVIATAVVFSGDLDARAAIVALMVVVWALRLGSFLFRRITREGADRRFDEIKMDPLRFLMAWTVQGLWVFLTLACALAVITGTDRRAIGFPAAIGAVIWLGGFTIEVIADRQKSSFKKKPSNKDRFITSGLWAWSRHPNYFGEITLWAGIAIIAIPVLSGWRWVTLISPLFVFVLLTRISGIPMLEARAVERWGGDPAFQAYTQATPALLLRLPRRPPS